MNDDTGAPSIPPKPTIAAETRKQDSFSADAELVRQAPFPNTLPTTITAGAPR
jgi:hypothetical protein